MLACSHICVFPLTHGTLQIRVAQSLKCRLAHTIRLSFVCFIMGEFPSCFSPLPNHLFPTTLAACFLSGAPKASLPFLGVAMQFQSGQCYLQVKFRNVACRASKRVYVYMYTCKHHDLSQIMGLKSCQNANEHEGTICRG